MTTPQPGALPASRSRLIAFVAVIVIAVGIGGGYLFNSIRDSRAEQKATAGTVDDRLLDVATLLDKPHIVFRSTSLGPTFGMVAVVPLSSPGGPRGVTTTACDRVYSAGESGLCMSTKSGVIAAYQTHRLGRTLSREKALETSGVPSRARVSSDGRLAATTTFVYGHSYAQAGFSTATTLYDAVSGKKLHNLEEFRVLRDGKVYRSPDINIWGVTFTKDSNRFYATLASKGTIYLVEGDVKARTLRTLRTDVECPSVSPDGSRIVYKKPSGAAGHMRWRLHLYDLTTNVDTPLTEKRSVDDQAEWLDDERVVYGIVRDGSAVSDVWVVPVDGGAKPKVLVPRAWSPAVVR